MAQIAFTLFFEGSQEVPLQDTAASGTGLVVFDTTTNVATYTWNISGLDFGPVSGLPSATTTLADDVTGFHFHNNVRGQNGPIVFDIPDDDADDLDIVNTGGNNWTISGAWEPSDPAGTSINTFAATLAGATIGSDVPFYGNVHTNTAAGGLIRGQWVASADDNNNTVTGTTLGDILDGLGGADTVNGQGGNDTLSGGSGNDVLNGGGGADVMNGGLGNDTFRVDNAGDEVNENAAQGTDTVETTRTTYTLPLNVEKLIFTGTGGFTGTGNDGKNTITGGTGNDTLNGGSGNDTLNGGVGNDTLNGGNQNDTLNGAGGSDTLNGAAGNDTLKGGLGNDFLTGGTGLDRFQFDTALNATTNVDQVFDFSTVDDKILLSAAVFTEAGPPGTLAGDAFRIGAGPADAEDRIIYSSATGALRYDQDGTGAAAAVKFATLPTGLGLTNANFQIV
jgi:serralysin